MLGWGVVGTGRVARQMAQPISDSPTSRLVGVLSRDQDRGRDFADDFGGAAVVGDISDLVTMPGVDVVYVASPNGLHAMHSLAAARAGRHVLCEKPMALTVAEGRAIYGACRENGVTLGVAFQYRHHRAVADLRDAIARGAIGQVVMVDACVGLPPMTTPSWYDDPAMAAGGVLPMSGIHRVDLVCHLLGGSPEEVSAVLTTREAARAYEDTAALTLVMGGGVLATVRCVMDVAAGADRIVVHGTTGTIEALGVTSQWWGGDGGSVTVRTADGTETTTYPAVDLYAEQVRAMEAAVHGVPSALATGAEGVLALAVQDAAIESSTTGRRVRVDHGEREENGDV